MASVAPGGGGGGSGGGGTGAVTGAADEEPHADIVVAMPRAAIARNMAEPPTALPIEVRNSRRAILGSGVFIFLYGPPCPRWDVPCFGPAG